MLKLEFKPYILQKKYVFRIAGGARTSTPLVLTKLSYDGVEGFGEASMPPLYGESIETTIQFISKIDLSAFTNPYETESILEYVDQIAPGNQAAKAAFDIALHDLICKLLGIPLHHYFGLPAKNLVTSKTIGIDTPEVMAQRVQEASDFQYLKIKLGTDNDRELVEAIKLVSDQPLYVDANQGWKDKEIALDFIHWLKEQGVVFIEQPLPKANKADLAWLTARSPLPIIGDEGIQRLTDLKDAASLYHGINIKLMKSTGLREAFKMANTPKALGLKIMLGCMSETSCAIAAAAHLGALADWIDLDGNLMITNDPYHGHQVQNGKIMLNRFTGIGLLNPQWNQIPDYVEKI